MSKKVKVKVQGIHPPGGDRSYWRDGYLIPVGEPIILRAEKESIRRWQTLPELIVEILGTPRTTPKKEQTDAADPQNR